MKNSLFSLICCQTNHFCLYILWKISWTLRIKKGQGILVSSYDWVLAAELFYGLVLFPSDVVSKFICFKGLGLNKMVLKDVKIIWNHLHISWDPTKEKEKSWNLFNWNVKLQTCQQYRYVKLWTLIIRITQPQLKGL